jgi:glycosyltransferase involved in cell wall biosynthesis
MFSQYSVVIPAYNAAATIAEAIDSVLTQTIPPSEIIVVDDGSTDDTAAIVSSIPGPIQVMRRSNGGPGAATTTGFLAAKFPRLATLDSDDLWLPRKIERQMEFLAANPGISATFTLAELFKRRSEPLGSAPIQTLWTRTTLLIDTAAALSVGAVIDPPGGRGEMVDWLARCGEMGYQLGMLEEVHARRRIRPGSLSYGRDLQRDAGYLHVVRLALERKRQRAVGSARGASE